MRALPVLTAALVLLTGSPALAAEKYPEKVPLPAGSLPEGIAGGPRDTFFAGSRADGSIVTGDLRTGVTRPLVDGVPGRVAVGMQYAADRTLWVAGGATGAVTQYDARTGKELFRTVVPTTGAPRFLNDVDVTADAVYVTDSRNAELVVVPRDSMTPTLLPLTGDWQQAATGNSANGIRVLPDGSLLVVNRGGLYQVDPVTGVADLLELTGPALTAGDGLELAGSTLYVVFGFGRNSVAVVDLATRTVTGELVDDDLDRPTTGTVTTEDYLYVVNGRFSTPATPTTEYDVVRVTR